MRKSLFLIASGLLFRILLIPISAHSQGWNVTQVGELASYWNESNKVTVAGNYAYVATGNTGLRIVDISQPAAPLEIGHCFTPGSTQDVAVMGNYAYTANSSAGLRIIDISNPEAPFEVGYCSAFGSASGIKVSGGYAYIAAGDSGLRIIDITDAHNPVEVGFCDTPTQARDVAVAGNYAYIADYDDGLRVIDISNPLIPTEVGHFDSTCARAVAVRDTIVYIAADMAGLWVVNVSNPAAPVTIGQCSVCPMGVTIDIVLQGDYAYTASPWYGMHIINISNPYSPAVVGNLYPSYPNGVDVAGDYAYLAYNCSSINELLVISISNPTNPIQVGMYDAQGSFNDVSIADTLAYTTGFSSGFQILNIANPASPYIVFAGGGWYTGLTVAGNYAYLTWCGYDEGGLQVIDISNPFSPHWLDNFNANEYTFEVQVVGNYAYLAAYTSGLIIVDISHPNALFSVGSCPTPGAAVDLAVSGHLACVADSWTGLRIIDITHPSNPVEVGSFGSSVNGVAIQGDYAYIADGSFHIIDISNPAAPVELGSLAIPASSVAVTGEYAFVCGGSNGIYVVKISNPYYPILVGSYDTPGEATKLAVQGNLAYLADYYNFGVYDCSEAMSQSLNLTLTPYHPPIIIPPGGGAFNYNIAVVNNDNTPATFDAWVNIENSSGYQFPILGPFYNLTLEAGSSIERDRTVFVPGRAPAGEYICWSFLGIYPWTVIDSDAFPFIKEGTDGIGKGSEGWLCAGEPFPGEVIIAEEALPQEFALSGAYPNPFNSATVLSFELREAGWVKLDIFNITGRSVGVQNFEPLHQYLPTGAHQVVFDGSELSSGVYFARLEAGDFSQTKKLLLLK